MVADKIPDYFDTLVRELKEDYSTVSYSRSYNDSPSKFPHIYFKRLNSSDALQTLSRGARGVNNSVEIHAYHDKGISKAEDFALDVKKICTEKIGLNCDYFSQMDNIADPKIIQFVMRFSALETEII